MRFFRCLNGFCWRGGIFLCAAIAWLIRPDVAFGADNAVSFLPRVWQTDQGLPHDSVNAILQTRDGYLWVGTRRGLVRFDGMHFSIPEIPELKAENIASLCEDRFGQLWIATGKGLFRWKDETISHYGQSDGLASDVVRTVCEGRDGSIFIGTIGGLTQFKDGKFLNFPRSKIPAHNVVRSVCMGESNEMWITTDAGLCQFKDGIISVPDFSSALRDTRAVWFDRENTLWVGTQWGLYRKKADGWERFDKEQSGLSDNFVNATYSDRTGQLWIGTYSGLNRLVNGRILAEVTPAGTTYDLVNAIVQDREGNIWIGSKEGLVRLAPTPMTTVTKQQGLTYNNVMSVLEDKAGTFWCGTWGGGVFQLSPKEIDSFAVTNWIPNSRILSVCDGQDGSLWFGADHGAGLYRLNAGTLTHFNEESGLKNVGIRIVYRDSEGDLWIGTSASLALFRNGKTTHYTTEQGLAGNSVRVVLEDKQNNLWVGTDTGLSRRTDGKFTSFTTKDGLSHNTVLALHEDKDKNLWIGTGGGGLNRLRNGRFTAYTTRNGLFNDDVLEILEDDDGHLWMSCLKGIFRVSKNAFDKFDRKEIETIPGTSYGKGDGMISVICNNVSKPAAWKASDGRLWFATTKGLVIADPKIKSNDVPPPVVIEEIVADKTRISQGNARSFTDTPIDHLVLPPGRGELEFHYTALSFRAPEKNRFKYKLEGVDPDWVDAATRRVAYYNNIGPGNYSFRVIGCNNDGVWNSAGAALNVSLQPHYWQTWWLKTLVIISSLSILGATVRYATKKRMQLKLERLEQQHAIERERGRIAKDMHDDLGANLTQITLLTELTTRDATQPERVIQHSRMIYETARELIQGMNEIVWAVNPGNDNLGKFAEYVFLYAERFLSLTSVQGRFDRPTFLPDFPLNAETRHSLFLVVKEALNNIVKHSGATEAWLRLHVNGSSLQITVEDNGRGFSPANTRLMGNGLSNMEKRIQSIAGRYELLTEPDKGTTIRFEIPLKNVSAN